MAFIFSRRSNPTDDLDAFITREMQVHRLPAVSLALLHNGIIEPHIYSSDSGELLAETLFQAGSVSKVLTACATLRLVEEGLLSLDQDVNSQLKSWNVPVSDHTATEKVTVRRLLSHTAGMTVHGFRGYDRAAPVPSLKQILSGSESANSSRVEVTRVPGIHRQYSGGGYVVLQQLLTDVTGQPFAELMRDLVLFPLEMAHSTFEQPLPGRKAAVAASGHWTGGAAVRGGWRVYPELAAAGLWTTASDLARLALAIQKAKSARSDGPFSAAIGRWMTTPERDDGALGLFLSGRNYAFFGHNGRNAGFDTFFRASDSDGVVVMANANDDTGALHRMARTAWELSGFGPHWS